jgi:hypothetical protein
VQVTVTRLPNAVSLEAVDEKLVIPPMASFFSPTDNFSEEVCGLDDRVEAGPDENKRGKGTVVVPKR